MPTQIHRLNERKEDYEILRGWHNGFLHGECYALAIALHRAFGWPMIGFIKNGKIEHAGVRHPDGRIVDARGFVSDVEFAQPFISGSPEIIPVTEEEMRSIRPIHEHSIRQARRFAESWWPELPWKESFELRAKAFADDLEAISRRHGIWIRAPFPAQPAILAQGDDEEAGYVLRATSDGLSFTIDRYFK